MLLRGGEKPLSAVSPLLQQLCATWLKCRDVTLNVTLQRDFLSSNHLWIISQSLFFDTGDLRPQSKLAAISSRSVTDPDRTSMTSFFFLARSFFPSS